MKRSIPWIVLVCAALWLLSSWLAPRPVAGELDLSRFSKIPVLVGGRVKPLDTVARNSLLIIHGKQQVRLGDGKSIHAMRWLTDVLFAAAKADQYPVFVIENAEVLGLFGWQQVDRKYFSFAELSPFLKQIDEQGEQSEKLQSVERSAFQNAVLNLRNGVVLYQRLKNSLQPEDAHDFVSELKSFETALPEAAKAAQQRQNGETFDNAQLERVAKLIQRYEKMGEMAYILAVPPAPGMPAGEWHSLGDSLLQSVAMGEIHPVVKMYALMGDAYRADNPSFFSQHVNLLAEALAQEQPSATKRTSFEFLFNRLDPFTHAMVLYVLAFLLACSSWLRWNRNLNRSAYYLLLLALAVHTFGLVSRMYLQERPPVTNLYSSAIFIGWGAVIVSLILERIFRDGIGAACAGAIGFITLIIAHHLAGSGDTLEMLQAVLDTNIWLATHVVAITTGYSAMFLAGMLAMIYIVRGVFTRSLKKETADSLSRMTYGVVCFRHALQFCRHRPRRHLGRSIVGPLLGLGPEGKRRRADCPLVRDHFARALGRIHSATRPDDHGDFRQCRHELLLVRRQHARRRPAFLRFHAKSISLAVRFHVEPARIDGAGESAALALAQLWNRGTGPDRTAHRYASACYFAARSGAFEANVVPILLRVGKSGVATAARRVRVSHSDAAKHRGGGKGLRALRARLIRVACDGARGRLQRG